MRPMSQRRKPPLGQRYGPFRFSKHQLPDGHLTTRVTITCSSPTLVHTCILLTWSRLVSDSLAFPFPQQGRLLSFFLFFFQLSLARGFNISSSCFAIPAPSFVASVTSAIPTRMPCLSQSAVYRTPCHAHLKFALVMFTHEAWGLPSTRH